MSSPVHAEPRRKWLTFVARWFTPLPSSIFGLMLAGAPLEAQFNGFTNHGLVGVGRLAATNFDALGPKIDTLGAIFSSLAFDAQSWTKATNASGEASFGGILYGLADRGSGGGFENYKPRVHQLRFSFTPYYGSAKTNQNQISLTNSASLIFHDQAGLPFTGFDANDTNAPEPRSLSTSPGQGHRSLDSEGMVRLPAGDYFICDEYGPFVYSFDPLGRYRATLRPPEAYLPKVGAAYGKRQINFSSLHVPDSGRRDNRGFEGLAITPDGKKLVALLQSPLVQDGGTDDNSRQTRLLIFNIDPASADFGKPVSEFIYQLTLQGNEAGNEQTLAGDLVALNDHQFLVVEHDSRGLGASETGPPLYKRVVLVDLAGATDILNSGYDLELGAPGQTSFRKVNLPAGFHPVTRQDFVDLLDPVQLSKFRLNLNSTPNNNTISEKWEGLTLVPVGDPDQPDDFFLLVGNDNDFQAGKVYHNGVVVDTTGTTIDNMLMAFRVTLPGYQPLAAPATAAPALSIRLASQVEIAWPAGFSNYQLQTSATLSNWSILSAASNFVVIAPTNRAQFFRLMKP